MNYFDLIRAFLSGGWDLFTKTDVPGLEGVSYAALLVAFSLASLGIRLVFFLYGLGRGGGSPRTGSTSRPKISKERSGDEF